MEEHLSDVYQHFRRDHAEVDAAPEGLRGGQLRPLMGGGTAFLTKVNLVKMA